MARLRVHTLRIPCTDLAGSAAWYARLLQDEPAFGAPATGWVGFELENVTLLLEPAAAGEFEPRYLGFSLHTADIAAFYREALERGVEFTGPPKEQVWGGIMTHVTDCAGNTFSIVQVDGA